MSAANSCSAASQECMAFGSYQLDNATPSLEKYSGEELGHIVFTHYLLTTIQERIHYGGSEEESLVSSNNLCCYSK